MSKSDEPAKAAEGFPVVRIPIAAVDCYHCGKRHTVSATEISDATRRTLILRLQEMADDVRRGYRITANQINNCLDTLK